MIDEQRSGQAAPVAESTERDGIEREVAAERVELRRAVAAIVRGERVEVHQGGAAVVLADDDVIVERGGARSMIAGENLTVSQGGAGMILAGGDATITRGGAGTLVVLGNAALERSGGALLVAGTARVGSGGTVGLALTRRLEVEPGARVLAGPRELAVAVVAGVIAGGVISLLLRR